MAQRTEITALHQDDTLIFLEKTGVAGAYERRQLLCVICGDPLLDTGLGAARLQGGEFVFACRKLDCMEEFHDRR